MSTDPPPPPPPVPPAPPTAVPAPPSAIVVPTSAPVASADVNATATPMVRRHPIRGVLYGILLGLGLALFAVGQRLVAFGEPLLIVILLAGVLIGVLWSTLGPPREADRRPGSPTTASGAAPGTAPDAAQNTAGTPPPR